MFESSHTPPPAPAGIDRPGVLEIRAWARGLAGAGAGLSDAERIDALRALEELKAAAAAAQARITADFAASQREDQRARHVRADEVGKGIAAQVALARRESPHRGAALVRLADAMVRQMPRTLAALERGVISEHRAGILVTQTSCLAAGDRALVDAEVAGDLRRLSLWGNQRLEAEVKRTAYRRDPQSMVSRAAHAVRDRRVSIRPAPDTMVWLTALLPVAEGVSCYASLTRSADTARAAGDGRTRGQVMADSLVERLTGRSHDSGPPVSVSLVMTDRALLAGHDEPAHVMGHGPIPAALARQALGRAERAWLRRLYTAPGSGQLVSQEAGSRLFPRALARFIALRDQTCRTPWCDAPIRHTDHVSEAAAGAPTSALNGQGLCEACNQAKTAPGWTARTLTGLSRAGPHTVRTTTPTGHAYTGRAPDPPGAPRARSRWAVDWVFTDTPLTLAA